MRAYALLTTAVSALAARVRGDDPERGDVPGWVMITVMTAALVLCVTVTVRIPLLPEFIDANTATGQFLVERDRYIDA